MKLNFGCGSDIKEGWDNVDMQEGKGVTKVFDFDKFPYPLKKNKYDYVLISQVLEHLIYPDRTLKELHKSCVDGAIIRIEVPHYSNKGAYNDLQHRGFFNEVAFENFVKSQCLIKKNDGFKIVLLEITPTIVGKFIPKYLRNKLGLLINGLHSQIHVEYEISKFGTFHWVDEVRGI